MGTLIRCVLLLALGLTGCVTTPAGDADNRVPGLGSSATAAADLVPPASEVGAMQLYRTGDETALPVVDLRGRQTLTLAFDLLAANGRPLDLHIRHADRSGRADALQPIQFIDGFDRVALTDFRTSQGTDVPYVHYRYEFPNASLGFKLSGAYRLRVTERGDPSAVLFERLFYVSENVGRLAVAADEFGGGASRFTRPVAQYIPPDDLGSSPFDVNACFVRDGRLAEARCAGQPSLVEMSHWLFRLDGRDAFENTSDVWTLDLGYLQPGRDILSVDDRRAPPLVVLEPDQVLLGGDPPVRVLNGQAVIADGVFGLGRPAVQASYVDVQFQLVPPDERPLPRPVYVVGAFNNWTRRRAAQMTWNPDVQRYQTTLRLKQGLYPYRYATAGGFPAASPALYDTYAAFIYYFDIRLNTDRLLAVGY